MANTYTLIASTTLSTAAAPVNFTSIPGTYTDLILRYSVRDDVSTSVDYIYIQFNANTGTSQTVYSYTNLRSNGATASSGRGNNVYTPNDNRFNFSTTTANTFTSGEMYIPSYTSAANKIVSSVSAFEDNSTTAYLDTSAGQYLSSSAVTSIRINRVGGSGGTILFEAGSSFYLYGIKNS
jgi:hypothetical protein